MSDPGRFAEQTPAAAGSSFVRWSGRVAGPLIAVGIYSLLAQHAAGLQHAGRATAAIGTLMAIFWMTEALPLPVTSLLPVILFPLAGVLKIEDATAPYASRYIFLFMGGFMIALAIERWNLHRRLALLTVLLVGTKPAHMVAGFMIATAALSLWISNTATTVMMLPIAASVVALVNDRLREAEDRSSAADGFPVCMMLGIAYAANIGGVGTLVGTPPNVFLAGFMEKQYGITLGFGQWMLLGIPFVLVFLSLTWGVLTKLAFPIEIADIPGGRDLIRGELNKLGPMSRGEWTVLCVFMLTAICWVLRGPVTKWGWLVQQVPAVARLDDTMIAMMGALLLFAIPVDLKRGRFALDWETAQKLPWGVLLLFGGGLSLASAVTAGGLDQWIGQSIEQLNWLPMIVFVFVVTTAMIFLTEVTSNIATATTFLPILGGVAAGLDADVLLLVVPAAMAASCAFMLPVATPPNAIVFGSGHVSIGQMAKAGLWLNLIGVVLIPIFMYTLGAWALGVQF